LDARVVTPKKEKPQLSEREKPEIITRKGD